MKIIFAGTPAFAATALKALIAAGHEIMLVLTQPDRPAGRGMTLSASPVKEIALSAGIDIAQPTSLKNDAQMEQRLAALDADVMVVAAYGLILPQSILDIPRLGCINIHASLLPRWRGAAPIHRALLAGDEITGITLMQMDKGLDTGAMLLQKSIPITSLDTTLTLHDQMATLGGQCIVELLTSNPATKYPGTPQDDSLACYAAKIEKSEAAINWQQSAAEIDRAIRGFNPFPGAVATIDGANVKIWQARPIANIAGKPGEIISVGAEGILVACGKNGLLLEIMQKPGGKRLPAAIFAQGAKLLPGKLLT